MKTIQKRIKVWFAAPLAALLLAGAPAAADPPSQPRFRADLAQLAREIKGLLDKQGEQSVAMGQFVGPPQLATSAGSGLAKILTEELQRLKVAVKTRSRLGIKGEFQDVTDKDSKQLAVQLRVRVVDRNNKALADLDCGILNNPDIAVLLGVTATLPAHGSDKLRNDKLKEQIDRPQVHIAGGRVSTRADSPFAVEILVDHKPRAARNDDGLAYAQIDRGEIYEVRLINNAAHEAAVALAIDGVGLFSFSEPRDPATGLPKYNYVIVAPKSSVTIKGWPRAEGLSDSFQVTEFAKSAAAYLQSTAKVGMITASFHACWPKGAKPPPPEGLRSRSGSATGFGPAVEQTFEVVSREIGVVRDVVTVRYTKD